MLSQRGPVVEGARLVKKQGATQVRMTGRIVGWWPTTEEEPPQIATHAWRKNSGRQPDYQLEPSQRQPLGGVGRDTWHGRRWA